MAYPIDAALTLKQRLTSNAMSIGVSLSSNDPMFTEIICAAGYDFLWICTEHTAIDRQVLNRHIRAAAITQTPVIVRIAWNHSGLVKPVLDMGAAGIMFPLTRTVDDVQQAIASCLYPPDGIRGYGPLRADGYGRNAADYLERANQAIHVWIQVEQIDLIDNLEEVVKLPGISGFYMGWNDLAASMRLTGQRAHPDVLAAGDRVTEIATKAGIPVIMGAPSDEAHFARRVEQGVRAFTSGGDFSFVQQMSDQRFQYVHDFLSDKGLAR